MKRIILSLMLLGSIVTLKINSMATLQKYLGLDTSATSTKDVSTMKTDPYDDRGIDNVAFWSTAVSLFEQSGRNPEFLRHAKTQLRRAQTLSLHERGLSPVRKARKDYSTLTVARAKDKLKDLTKTTKTRTEREQDAFERGKKAGEARQRRMLKKKAEEIKARMEAQKRAKKRS
jgi:hypothetical protein